MPARHRRHTRRSPSTPTFSRLYRSTIAYTTLVSFDGDAVATAHQRLAPPTEHRNTSRFVFPNPRTQRQLLQQQGPHRVRHRNSGKRPSGSCCNVPRFTLVTGVAVALVVTPLLSLTSSPQAGATAVPAWIGVSAPGPPIAVGQQRPLTSRSTTPICGPPVQCSYRFGIGTTTYPYGAP